MLRDVLTCTDTGNARVCADITCASLDIIVDRARARGETAPDSKTLMDRVVAPLVYRILFSSDTPTPAYAQGLLDAALASADSA